MKIIVDAYGGDNAPNEIVEGALLALEKDKDLEIVLAGKEDELSSILQGRTDRVSVLAAEEVITNHDVPTVAVRAKKNSSMVKACYELKNNGRFADRRVSYRGKDRRYSKACARNRSAASRQKGRRSLRLRRKRRMQTGASRTVCRYGQRVLFGNAGDKKS